MRKKEIIRVLSTIVGGSFLACAVGNLEAEDFVDSTLFDWRKLILSGIIILIPAIVISARELWREAH